MYINKLETQNSKTKVYIDEEYHFTLYPQDIKLYKIEEDMELSEEEYEKIIKDTVLRRGKQKALALLKYMDRSEYELSLKLKQAGYTSILIDCIIEYVKSYHYIDDARYTSQYIKYKKESKSKKQIKMELMQKGISNDIIALVMEEEYEDEEVEDTALLKAISKKTSDPSTLNEEQKLKLRAYLYRKGFSIDAIKKHIKM